MISVVSVLSVVAVIAIVYTECSVIRLQEIPIQGNLCVDVLVKEDAKGSPVATLRIVEDKKNKDSSPIEFTVKDTDASSKFINQFVKATGDIIPNFERKFGFGVGGSNCAEGQVRHGPACV